MKSWHVSSIGLSAAVVLFIVAGALQMSNIGGLALLALLPALWWHGYTWSARQRERRRTLANRVDVVKNG